MRALRQVVELAGVVVEHHVGDFQGAGACNLAVVYHFREGEAERLAAGSGRYPAGFFPVHFFGEWIGVGRKQDLFGRVFQPFANRSGDGARIIREVCAEKSA